MKLRTESFALLLVAAALLYPRLADLLPKLVVAPSPNTPTVSTTIPVELGPLATTLKTELATTPPDIRTKLSALYASLAELITLDDPTAGGRGYLKTTGQLREAHQTAGKILFQKNSLPPAPALTTIDTSAKAYLSTEDKTLDPTTRAKAVTFFTALSAAVLP